MVKLGKRHLPEKNKHFMKRTSKKRLVSAESIARLADSGTDISSYFTNKGKMMSPFASEIDLSEETIEELNDAATGCITDS